MHEQDFVTEQNKIYVEGLRDIEGTFVGLASDDLLLQATTSGVQTVYLYGLDPDIPWWKHWFYRFREWANGIPYPQIVLATGPASMETWTEDLPDGSQVVHGTFKTDGRWYLHDAKPD